MYSDELWAAAVMHFPGASIEENRYHIRGNF